MKSCKKCGCNFPSYAWIEGKKQSLTGRSYCLICSPFNAKKGYKLRKENRANTKFCLICEREFAWNKNDVCSSCRTTYQRWIKRQKAIDLLGGKCKNCGERDHDLLTFHHVDETKKDFTLADCWHNISWEKIAEELKKCQLLCYHCHIKHHLKDKNRVLQYYGRVVELADTQDLKSCGH